MRFLPAPRILAIDPVSRGLGIAVLESPHLPIDWGVKDLRSRTEHRTLDLIENLIEGYQPDVVVLEDTLHPACRRCVRIRSLIDAIRVRATSRRIRTERISRESVYQALGVRTKYEAARKVATLLVELAPSLPPPRKPWMNEDPRMSIFDATAFALAYYHLH